MNTARRSLALVTGLATLLMLAAAIGQAVYTFTVVPEPSTWSLLGLGGMGSFGLTWLRARRCRFSKRRGTLVLRRFCCPQRS
jgi:hypothetical protein